MTLETRNITTQIDTTNDDSRTITGYAVKWNKNSHVMGTRKRFSEQFLRGAFFDSIQNDDQKALWSHDVSKVLGSTRNNTLRLSEDEIGLRFEVDLPNTTLGNDTYESIKRGDIDGVSFGFQMISQSWNESDPNNIIRMISKAKLIEISPVAFPAYPDSEVSARSVDAFKDYEKQQQRKKLLLKTFL